LNTRQARQKSEERKFLECVRANYKNFPIWGLAASPVAAHDNYLQDNDVIDIIACGMTGATINRCTP
jgi:hypothetical protein